MVPVLPDSQKSNAPQLFLAALVEYFPLSGLRELSLSHVYIFPDLDDMHRRFEENASDFDVCADPFQFFASMNELEVLALVPSTPMILDVLTYIPLNETSPKQPLPALKHLNLPQFHLPVVWDFLPARSLYHEYFKELESISFHIPTACRGFPELEMRVLCRNNLVRYPSRCDFTDLYLRDRDYMATTYNHWI